MIIEPKIRGFICTTAHPKGCYENVKKDGEYAEKTLKIASAPKRVLVLGASTGYGLATRLAAAFGGKADTIGVFYERPGSEKRTASAGYYNNEAFLTLAKTYGGNHVSINGDAFSKEVKTQVIEAVKANFEGGQVDLIVYSLAAPKRIDHQGSKYGSVIKPIGESFMGKTLDFNTGIVSEVEVEPATQQEIEETVKVMGGEDWKLWIEALKEGDCLGENVATVAFSYIGPEMTHAIYTNGTIGAAKLDMEEKCSEIDGLLKPYNGRGFVSVNKALVTQASAAIPVVPLYISILYKVMKEAGTHENCIQQGVRLLQRMYPSDEVDFSEVAVDEKGRIRLDDWEMEPKIQEQVLRLWQEINTGNVREKSDLDGYLTDFYRLFGFKVDGVDYSLPVEIV